MKDEKKLVKKARKGQAEAFGLLYNRHLPAIYRFIFLKVNHQQDAEDLTHQVFLQAWQGIKSYRLKGFPFSSWLYRIASNKVVDYYRTKKTYIELEYVSEENLAESDPLPQKKIDTDLDLALIKKALKKLEPEQQNILIMIFVNDLANQEIAQAIGKSLGAIRVIQHRALKKLKNLLYGQNK